METYCPVSGLKLDTLYKERISDHYTIQFTKIGDSILHSVPGGFSDEEDLRCSLEINEKIAEDLYKKNGYFIQIEDYILLEGSSSASRSHYAKHLNNSRYLKDLIFCNLKPLNRISVKIGQRFLSGNTSIHVARNYSEAVLTAMALAEKRGGKNLLSEGGLLAQQIGKSGRTRPVEITSGSTFQFNTERYSCRSVILDGRIIHSVSNGSMTFEDVDRLNKLRRSYNPFLKPVNRIEYVIVDDSGYVRSDNKTRKYFIESIKTWHKQTGFRLYILYGTNAFMKAVIQMTKRYLPFRIIIVKNLTEAYRVIERDRKGEQHREMIREQTGDNENIDQLLQYLADIKWDENGALQEHKPVMDESYGILIQAFRLIKEEIDALFNEREEQQNQLEQALRDKQNLMKELQHRVKNSFLMISNMVKMEQGTGISAETARTLDELLSRISAVSGMYELLDDTPSIHCVSLNVYMMKLISRFQQAAPHISFNCQLEPVTLPAESVIPAGLILSELITNSLKHAFPGGDRGVIEITLRSSKSTISFLYRDSGPGLKPEQLQESDHASMGHQLINSLCRQLKGESRWESNRGLEFSLHFNKQPDLPQPS